MGESEIKFVNQTINDIKVETLVNQTIKDIKVEALVN